MRRWSIRLQQLTQMEWKRHRDGHLPAPGKNPANVASTDEPLSLKSECGRTFRQLYVRDHSLGLLARCEAPSLGNLMAVSQHVHEDGRAMRRRRRVCDRCERARTWKADGERLWGSTELPAACADDGKRPRAEATGSRPALA